MKAGFQVPCSNHVFQKFNLLVLALYVIMFVRNITLHSYPVVYLIIIVAGNKNLFKSNNKRYLFPIFTCTCG